MTRSKTLSKNLAKLASLDECLESAEENDPVIFILGDNEKLINLKDDSNSNIFDMSTGKQSQEEENFSNEQLTMLPACQEDGSKEEPKSKINVITFPLPRYV